MLAISEGAMIVAVPCVPEEKGTSEEDRTLNLIISNEGKPLTILEMAVAFKRLIDFGRSVVQIAKESGYSRNHVDNCLMLLAASKELRDMVIANKVTATGAIKLIHELGEKEALAQIKGAVKTAEEQGKKGPVSRKHTEAGGGGGVSGLAEKRVNWKEWGPKLHHALEAIVTCPVTGKGSENLQQYIADGNELVQQMEDEGYTGKV
jgi:ParB-like chromosome segregation protein Spo0J